VVALAAGCGDTSEDAESPATTTTEEATTQETTTAPVTTVTETTTHEPAQPTLRIIVRGGASQGGIRRLTVTQGDQVKVLVTSDTADHVHVHGYDLMKDVGPGSRAVITFTADIPGRFEIELEDLGRQIGELEVRP
jgi:nitrous oxide reductase